MKFLIVCFVFYVTAQAKVAVLDSRIVGGEEVDISVVPYQVSLRYFNKIFCGGSILKPTIVLTAAHCIYNKDHSDFKVSVGNRVSEAGTLYNISSFIWHELYNSHNTDYDVAIIKLSNPITYSSNAQPIALQPKDVEVPVGTTAVVSGWGLTTENGTPSPTLRAVYVKVISQETCASVYNNTTPVFDITPRMLCARADGKGSCFGDSGGPLVAEGKLIGVVSWALRCGHAVIPGVYAKVSNLYDWIDENST